MSIVHKTSNLFVKPTHKQYWLIKINLKWSDKKINSLNYDQLNKACKKALIKRDQNNKVAQQTTREMGLGYFD